MPIWMSSVIASCLPVLALSRHHRSATFFFAFAGTACFVAILISTLLGNVAINNRGLGLYSGNDSEEFVRLRERWDRLHTFRVLMTVAGLGFLLLGALGERSRR
jgi:Anthrone oxygenase